MRIVFLLQTYHKNSLSERGEMPYLLNTHLKSNNNGSRRMDSIHDVHMYTRIDIGTYA